MDNKQLLGRRIKELIKIKGISQEKLSEIIGIEPTALSNIVTGRNYPLFSTLEKIVNTLDVTFVDVFNFHHLNSNENLKSQIINVLESHPERMSDFYRIAIALVK